MSYPAAKKELPLTWLKVAETVFNETVREEFVQTNGLHNQMFIDCSYQEQLMKKPSKSSKPTGSCQYFDYSLTSKGVCHSFNSFEQSNIWQPSKIVNSFQQIISNKHPDRKLGGTGSNQGMTLNQFARLYHKKISLSISKDYYTTEKSIQIHGCKN
jgi:hypothetical protein